MPQHERYLMFPDDDAARVKFTQRMRRMLDDDVDQIIDEWIREFVSEEYAASGGRPDTSRSAVVSVARSLSVPGAYSVAPRITGSEAEEIKRVVDLASLWPRKAQVQYYSVAMVDCAVFIDLPPDLGRPTIEIVDPSLLWVEEHESDPLEPILLRRLRCRELRDDKGDEYEAWCWDEYDIRDQAAPAFRIVEAKMGGEIGMDLTEVFLGRASPTYAGPTGEDGSGYPFWDNGVPFIPYEVHRSRDLGRPWGYPFGRSAFRASLNGMMNWTDTNKAMRLEAGKINVICGMTIKGTEVRTVSVAGAPVGVNVAVIQARPGDVLQAEPVEGHTAQVFEIGGAGDLTKMMTYATVYDGRTATDMGVSGTDSARVSSNPMSGDAIRLTNETKRFEQLRQTPLCLRADLSTIRKMLALCRAAGLTQATGKDMGIIYHEIPKGPDEMRNEREQDDWDDKHGLVSGVDLYMRRNPSASRQQAIDELARVAMDKRDVMVASGQAPQREWLVGSQDGVRDVCIKIAAGNLTEDAGRILFETLYGIETAVADQLAKAARSGSITKETQVGA